MKIKDKKIKIAVSLILISIIGLILITHKQKTNNKIINLPRTTQQDIKKDALASTSNTSLDYFATTSIRVYANKFLLPANEKIDSNPFKLIDCEFSPKIYYWTWYDDENFYKKHDYEQIKNIKQGNFYITCEASGTGKFLNTYIFRNNKLIFKKENVARGRFFVDRYNLNDFYLITEIFNAAANSQPLGYVLFKLQYDPVKNGLYPKKITIYPSYFINYYNSQGNWGQYYNKDLYDFEEEHSSKSDIETSDYGGLDWSTATKFEPDYDLIRQAWDNME